MRECISISKLLPLSDRRWFTFSTGLVLTLSYSLFLSLLFTVASGLIRTSLAAEPPPPGGAPAAASQDPNGVPMNNATTPQMADPNAAQDPNAPPGASSGDASKPHVEEEDYSTTPFTEYGEFNQAADEENDTKFFQYGRFFGVSLGLGYQFVDGARGALWQGGFPMVDFKFHYWFDFNVAIDMGFYTAQQFFDTTAQGLGHVDISMVWVGVDVKYYFQTKNLSAPITFASPYILGGAGAFTKTQNSNAQQTQDQDTSIGINVGGGLEFTLSPKKLYFEAEVKMHVVTFKDTFTTDFTAVGLPNLTGNFYTISGNLLFTW